MPINVSCECGATYRVKDELDGKLMRCKSCDARVRIVEAARQTAKKRSAPEPNFHSDPKKEQLAEELRRSRETSNTAASNPGMMRVSYLTYIRSYPTWPMIWLGGFAGSLLLCSITLWMIPVAAFFAFAVWLYFSRLKAQFVAGCVNPSTIVSVNPPLVATFTDLTKGGSEFLVVKIEKHPIHRLNTGPAAEEQRLTTVAFYESAEDELEHWTNFTPRLTACATTDQRIIQTQLTSIDEEDWEQLWAALEQVPDPLEPGLYRYYPPESLNRPFDLPSEVISNLIENVMEGVSNCLLMSEGKRIPSEARAYIPGEARADIQAVINSAQVSADEQQGIALSAMGAYYHFSELGKGQFAWDELAGAFLCRGVLELTFTDGERMEIPQSHFLSHARVRLEILLDTIGRGTSEC